MYWLLVLCLLGLGEARHRRHGHDHDHKHGHDHKCDRHRHDHNEAHYNFLSRDVFDADRKDLQFCIEQQQEITETFSKDIYKLSVTAKNYTEDDVKIVEIKYRVVYIKVEKDNKKLEVIRILPDIISPSQAQWNFENEQIQILIPYNIEFDKDVKVDCADSEKNKIVLKVTSVPKVVNPQEAEANKETEEKEPEKVEKQS